MVRAFTTQATMQKTKSFQLKRMFEIPRHLQNLIFENGQEGEGDGENVQLLSPGSRTAAEDGPVEAQGMWGANHDKGTASDGDQGERIKSPIGKKPSDMEMMKERFSKLLLGEDMSGGGKGVSSALALSNSITNLAASVFGEQRKLEPMSPDRKARWVKEIGWLLSVTDHIVEFVPSQQNGTNMEIMVTRQRNDLHMNIPALRKLDGMLIGHLDSFGTPSEFWYVKRDAQDSEKGDDAPRNEDKWWKPTVKVPPEGLSDECRRWLQSQKESVNQVLKAAMAINAQVLSEMEIPDNYIESLPKNGRASLGDSIYKCITVDYFDPVEFFDTMDLSTEHKVLDLKDRIEASIVIWKRKMNHKDGKSSWSSVVSLEKRELFEERVETILLLLKQKFPGIPQSALDISKIQYNKDVGYAILESYSRVIESLAFNVMSMVEDVLYADNQARKASSNRRLSVDSSSPFTDNGRSPYAREDADRLSSSETPTKTLFEFMGWNAETEETDMEKDSSTGNKESYFKEDTDKSMNKPPTNINTKRFSYLEKLEKLSGLRSPTARH
ncbi:rop guanine nucleotide exchange factor 9 isoform X2 [Prunus yedoensis var. nudiflora]|uniref:Rop guanine nucleotide exchange factor 9 isoform X2 n=1 Tax=Prunus yedoensis var. nudiflora TaxID=2094558 RepID=A0A314XNR8_PRUYE|nr:rop guanine nucleotide exchange factor 9 isoform X2 [Prunus yedoensis var. nudiflora]